MTEDNLKTQINALIAAYYEKAHAPQPFVAGQTPVQVAGCVYDSTDMNALTSVALDFWLSGGKFSAAFEKKIAEQMGVAHALIVNAGSSANLLAVAGLASPFLGDGALRPGDEVITPAAGFPTTINPLFLYGLTPVFVDVDIPTYNATAEAIEAAITPKTRAIIAAHTLGNPFEAEAIEALAQKHDLYLIEDCCDALGAKYKGRNVGTFGCAGTLSFYAAHTITTGEGGALFTNDKLLHRVFASIRDAGKDCNCAPHEENKCGKRYEMQLGTLPYGFDHRYTYSNLGYNLKMTEMQASLGCAQMDHLPSFLEARARNFARLAEGLKDLEDIFILPRATAGSEPAWFGFPLTLREDAPFDRAALLRELSAKKIATRLLFGGNLIHQPYMKDRLYRVAGDLKNSDRIMNQSFWLGVYPGLCDAAIDFMIEVLHGFCRAEQRNGSA
jgi:CDP-6-deoxy-D-xylo-4-hexulose-3-dehydrase